MSQNKFKNFFNKISGADRALAINSVLKGVNSENLDKDSARRIHYARKQALAISFLQKVKFVFILILVVCLIALGVAHFSSSNNKSKKKASATTSKETKTQKKESSALAEEVDIKMSFTGDFILGMDEAFAYDTSFNAYFDNRGPDYFLQNVRQTFQEDDLTVINMEGTLTTQETRQDKQFAFKADPSYVSVLTNSSIEAANVANNHSHDYGEQSFADTVNTLEQNNIKTFGYDEVNIIEVKGVKVGLLGIYELDDHLERVPQLQANIQKLKDNKADIIVAVFHWSNELVTVPDINQVTLGHMAIDEGADIVVGHHAHVLQGIEEYKGKKIVYGLGNFCFGGNTHPQEFDTMIFQETFHVNKNKEVTSLTDNIIPCSVSSDPSINNYQPTILSGDEATRVLNLINERSAQIVSYE